MRLIFPHLIRNQFYHLVFYHAAKDLPTLDEESGVQFIFGLKLQYSQYKCKNKDR